MFGVFTLKLSQEEEFGSKTINACAPSQCVDNEVQTNIEITGYLEIECSVNINDEGRFIILQDTEKQMPI